MAQQNGCSMDLAVDEEDGLEGAVDGVVVDGSSAINGHPSAAVTSVDGAAAAGPPSSSSASPAISRVDRDVIRLIAQHLQNLGLKYVDWRWVKRGCADVWMWHILVTLSLLLQCSQQVRWTSLQSNQNLCYPHVICSHPLV